MLSRCQLLPGRPIIHNVVIRTAQSTRRTYATSDPAPVVKNPLRRKKGGDLGTHLPKHVIPIDAYIPAYPYGDHALFKQANRGLYGDQMIHFGNNVSEKTETKTRRDWKPNVLSKGLYSVALKKKIKLRITSRVLKTMDREGGLDEYLLKDNEHRLKELGPLGWALRWTLMQKPEVIDRMRAQASALGVDQATIDAQWPTPRMLNEQRVSQAGFVRATDLVGEDEHEEAEEGDTEYDITRLKRRIRERAREEYLGILKTAHRYLARQHVNSEAEGIKLAFIRAKEHKEAFNRFRVKLSQKLDKQFSPQEIAEARLRLKLPSELSDSRVRKILSKERKPQEIEEAGSHKAWIDKVNAEEDAIKDAEEDAITMSQYAEANHGKELPESELKNHYAKMIEEAEKAASNEALDHSRREFLKTAMAKADKMIRERGSGGQGAWVQSAAENYLRDLAEQAAKQSAKQAARQAAPHEA
jgi:large subunit ribosomal protein L28